MESLVDENKDQAEKTEPEKGSLLKISVDRISSKTVKDPLQPGFTFVINGNVYQVYGVRDRGRKLVKFIGRRRDGGN